MSDKTVSEMLAEGSIELVGDAGNGDYAVYRETKTGSYRVGKRRSLDHERFATEEAATARADFYNAAGEAQNYLDAIHNHMLDAPTAALEKGAQGVREAASILYRTEAEVERIVSEGGDQGYDERFVGVPPQKKNKPLPKELTSDVVRALHQYECQAELSPHDRRGLVNEAESETRAAAYAHAVDALWNAIVDHALGSGGRLPNRPAVEYRGVIYIAAPAGGDGSNYVLRLPTRDIRRFDDERGIRGLFARLWRFVRGRAIMVRSLVS